jgi:hypothetical protein
MIWYMCDNAERANSPGDKRFHMLGGGKKGAKPTIVFTVYLGAVVAGNVKRYIKT